MSKTYALVKNGLVQNIIVLAEGSVYNTDCEIIEIDSSEVIEVGYIYTYIENNNIFTNPNRDIEITVTPEMEQAGINSKSLQYLADTDFYIIRESDTGIPCPPAIKIARAEARAKIVR